MEIYIGEIPFSCDICESSFSQNSHLKNYMQIHNGDKPFNYQMCGSAFSLSFILKSHANTHWQETIFL